MRTTFFVLLYLLLALLYGCEQKPPYRIPKYPDNEQDIYIEGDCLNVVAVEMLAEDGSPYTIDAVKGQMCVWFEESFSYNYHERIINGLGGKILSKIPKNGYYLVEVPFDKMQNTVASFNEQNGVNWAYPNMVFYPNMLNNYVLDTEYPNETGADTPPHGIIVKYALWDSDPESPLKLYNIGTKDGKAINKDNWDEGVLCPIFGCSHNEYFALKDISEEMDNEPIIINMSYGPSLKRKINGKEVQIFWKSAMDDEKRSYKENYVNYIKTKIKNLSSLKGRDYIVVIAAGNDGIKDLDAEILSYLRNKLSLEEIDVIDKHFLLVTAGETEKVNQDYSNEMEVGHYDPWVTKVDISDFKYEGKKWRGTSFAAPRAAGILSSVANEMNLTGAEVLKLAKEVTKRDGELTKDALLQAAYNEISDLSKEVTIEGVLRMYLLNSGRNVINTFGDEDLNNPYGQIIYEYRETDFDNTYLAFVVDADNAINVIPYLEAGDDEFLDNSLQTSFMLVPQFQYNGKDFAAKYANKRVRATGSLYVPAAGWRNATEVMMDLRSITLVDFAGSNTQEKQIVYPSIRGDELNGFSTKPNFGMEGWYDYNATISYSEDLFKNKSFGIINLPNGDAIKYQYVYECDIFPEYYMKYSMANGGNITSKYSIVLVKTIGDEEGYVGEDADGYIDMRISYFGFDPDSKSNMTVLIRKK